MLQFIKILCLQSLLFVSLFAESSLYEEARSRESHMQESLLRSQTYPPRPSLSESDSTLSLDSSVDGSDYRSWCGGSYVYLFTPLSDYLPFVGMVSFGKTYRSGWRMTDWSFSSIFFLNDFRYSESWIYYINPGSKYRLYGSVGLGGVCGVGGVLDEIAVYRAGAYVPVHFGLESESFIFDLEIGPEVTGGFGVRYGMNPFVLTYVLSGFRAGCRF